MESKTESSRPIGKIRNPVLVIIYSIITLGIYSLIYYYKLFKEMYNWRGQGWSGGLFLLFTFLPPISGLALPWLLPAYIGRMYAEDNQEKPITGLAGFWVFVPIIGGIIWLVKAQNNLNLFWEAKGAVA